MRTPYLISLLAALFTLTACSPRVVTVERVRSDSVYLHRLDSVYLRDSVFFSERRAGDTVYLTRERWRFRDRLRHDTLRLVRRDSVPVPVEVVREVRRPFFRELRDAALWLCLPLALAALCLFLWRRR